MASRHAARARARRRQSTLRGLPVLQTASMALAWVALVTLVVTQAGLYRRQPAPAADLALVDVASATPQPGYLVAGREAPATATPRVEESDAASREASSRGERPRSVTAEETPTEAAPPPATEVPQELPAPPTTEDPQDPPPPPSDADKGQQIAAIAAQYVGYPYRYGGSSPATGFDCSGFTWYVCQQAGVEIPNHDLWGQLHTGTPVARDQLLPGDLVFFANTYQAGLSHAGVYVGEGRFVHAATPAMGVRYDALDDAYWAPKFFGASRPW